MAENLPLFVIHFLPILVEGKQEIRAILSHAKRVPIAHEGDVADDALYNLLGVLICTNNQKEESGPFMRDVFVEQCRIAVND